MAGARTSRTCPTCGVDFATEPERRRRTDGSAGRSGPTTATRTTLARPWALPGTPGLEHRIGGIEKADGTGEISYDPDNHDLWSGCAQAKVDGHRRPAAGGRRPDTRRDAELLVLGWGSTYGPIAAGARARPRQPGSRVATAHLRHLNPFPANTGEVLRRYRRVLVPEMNLGQLALLLRARYLVDVQGYNRVRGLPFSSAEIADAITQGDARSSRP